MDEQWARHRRDNIPQVDGPAFKKIFIKLKISGGGGGGSARGPFTCMVKKS